MIDIRKEIGALADMEKHGLRVAWRRHYRTPPPRLSRDLLIRAIAYKMQERIHGGLRQATKRRLASLAHKLEAEGDVMSTSGLRLKPGAKLVREWHGDTHSVLVLEDGFEYRGERHRTLSKIARAITGAHWSGPRFFGLAPAAKPFSGAGEADHE